MSVAVLAVIVSPSSPSSNLVAAYSSAFTTCADILVQIPVQVRKGVTAVVIVTSPGTIVVTISTTSSSYTSTVVSREVAISSVLHCAQCALVTVCNASASLCISIFIISRIYMAW